MFAGFVVVVVVSLVLQVAVAVLAIRLIRITESSWAWIIIAVATLAMAVRRLMVVIAVLTNPRIFDSMDRWSEAIGLLNAALLLLGIWAIGPLFRTIQQAKQAMQRSRDELETEVHRRTADLVRAHETLREEFTQRANAEAALREEQNHLRRVLEICERDQRLVAYDIHDGFIQPATAALMNLQAGLAMLSGDPQKAVESVERGLQLLQESIAEVRWLISGLRPIVLEDLGLVAAVEKLVDDTEARSGIPIRWSHHVEFHRLAPDVEKSAFRIIQEALRNAVRHSHADRIELSITQRGGTVEIRIQDWGRGFDAAIQKPGHFGLEGIGERARLLGGVARTQTAPGEGTTVIVEFPLPSEEDERRAQSENQERP